MSYRRYLWTIQDWDESRRMLFENMLPIRVYCTGEGTRDLLLQELYTPAHPDQIEQVKQPPIPSVRLALSILQPIRYTVDIFESLQAYDSRVKKYLNLERFLRDPISLEERTICSLLEKHTVKVTGSGAIDLHHLGTYMDRYKIPKTVRENVVTFCKFLIRRFPVSGYCWFCGRINPFSVLPENVGLLPRQYRPD